MRTQFFLLRSVNCRVNIAFFFFQINVLPDAPNDINARLRLRLAHVVAPAECRALLVPPLLLPPTRNPTSISSRVRKVQAVQLTENRSADVIEARPMRSSRSLAGRMPLAARLVSPIVDFTNFQIMPSSCYGNIICQLSVPRRNRLSSYRRRIDGRGLCRSVASQAQFHAHLFIHSSHLFRLESRLAPRFYDHPCVISFRTVIAHAVISVDSRHGGSRPMIAAESGTAAAGAA